MFASFSAMPRSGHREAMFHIFGYIKNKHNSRMLFDPTYPEIDVTVFKQCDWREFYSDVSEPIPPSAPPPRGKEVVMVLLNMAPIAWLSKKQAKVATCVFGAEFCHDEARC